MQNIPRWKKSDRGSSHFRHGLDPRLSGTVIILEKNPENHFKLVILQSFPIMGKIVWHLTSIKKCKMSWGALIVLLIGLKTLRKAQ